MRPCLSRQFKVYDVRNNLNMDFFVIPWVIMTLLVLLQTVNVTQGLARFTQVPPSVLYVSKGNTARFVWDYYVDDITTEFEESSPIWFYYSETGSVVLIGYEIVFEGRKWKINNRTCPRRLLDPTRVSKESNATLVIKNVTKHDSGVYGCSLMIAEKDQITNKVRLVVTTKPKFTTRKNVSSADITEGKNLNINCSAVGDPTPNITWSVLRGVTKEIKNKGPGSAVLSIQNITRNQSGRYECQASNNPNESPVTMEIDIQVHFSGKRNIVNSSPSPGTTAFRRNNSTSVNNTQIFIENTHIHSSNSNTTDAAEKNSTKNNNPKLLLPDSPKVKVSAINSSSITIRWTTAFKSGRIFIIGFMVQINTKPTQETITRNNYLVITGLKENTKYVVKVYARTNVGYGNATTLTITTKKQESSHSKNNIKRKSGQGVTVLLAAVIGSALLILVVVVLVIKFYKKCSFGKCNKTVNNISTISNEGDIEMHTSFTDVDAAGNSLPIYAQVDFSNKRKNRKQDEFPVYAQVDKSKKKRSRQIIYAELESLKPSEEMPGAMSSTTVYADIQSLPSQKETEPIYETFPNTTT